VPLLILLLLCGAAAAPFSIEKAYRDARAAMDLGDIDAARTRTEAALARAGQTENEWVWALRVLKAYILMRAEKGNRALLERELPLQYRNSEAAVWRLIGLAYAEGADLKAGHAWLEQARRLAEAKQPRLLFEVYLSLANVDPPNWESHLGKALQLARRDGNRIGIALVRAGMAHRYTSEERYLPAIDAGREALTVFEVLRVPGRAASVAGNLAWAYQNIGDWETAAELYVQGEALAVRAGNSSLRVKWENQLGNIYLAQRRYADAERSFLRALEHSRALTGTERPWILTNLARLALDTGKLADARRYVDEALQTPRTPGQDVFARIIEARLGTVTGEHARAERMLRDLVAKTDEADMKWLAQGYLAQLYARTRRNDLADAAYRAAMDTAQEARKSVRGNRELALSFFNNSAEIFNSYIDFLVRNERHEDALAATETIRGQTLEEGLGMPAATRRLDTRAIARQHRATILSYWLDRDRSHLWVVTSSDVRYVELPPHSAIEREANAYRRDLVGRNDSLTGSGARGQQLYRMLVGPAQVAKGSRVIVIADDVLHALNFETLVVAAPKPHYWIEDVIISSASSLQLLAQAAPKKSGGASMLLVGDPPVADAAFPKLAFAAEELRTVGRHFSQPKVLAGPNATPAAYRAAAPERFDYVHFVAHGVSSRLRPLDSAVILGRDTSRQYKLYARDIVARPLHARLVTISSCYGAGERTFAGEGLVGLAWAFLHAGASQVIAALWEVNDRATPKLMDRMYGGIRAGHDPAVALRDAKLTLVNGKDAHRKARYWAPFVLYSGH
jgi:CHAT domain-containing protein